jgi:acyl transferase domain-containing protein/NADPH:quinone reductase-like Zn-dependent oxidoreductase/acyl carrier protein
MPASIADAISAVNGAIDLPSQEPIAIVGIGCRFPGDVEDPRAFWKLLCNGVDAVSEVPPNRWSVRNFYSPRFATPGKTCSRWGGFLANIEGFDAKFFGISPREAACMDPQHRLLLEVAWEAIEDAGVVPERLRGTKAGVFVGISTQDYALLQSALTERPLIDPYTNLGAAMCIAANRISYALDLRGPSLAVDTACSSSLVAVHLACESLWRGECTAALVGGVNVILRPESTIGFSQAGMLSPTGHCRSFDVDADGYVRSEGAAIVVLKPLPQALAGGDFVYAVIRATAINHDGKTTGIAVPSVTAQEEMLREAYRRAKVSPEEVQYVEAHGTGTPVGDPIEARAIGGVMGRHRPVGRPCAIGSVKSNIGHLEAASGIAGLIKAALCLKHRHIPPTLHFKRASSSIPLEELGLCVPTTLIPWPGPEPRIAGVNAFGFGGTNAHVVLAGAPSPPPVDTQSIPKCRAYLLPLSGRSPEARHAVAAAYCSFLDGEIAGEIADVEDIVYTAGVCRTHHEHRLAVVGDTRQMLVEGLRVFLRGDHRMGVVSGHATTAEAPRLAFVFSGMGPQWWAMGRELADSEPVFRASLVDCDARFRELAGWSLLEQMSVDHDRSRMNRTDVAQPTLFALQVALAALWREWGVEPAAVIGHSVGEVAAAQVAGVLSLDDAVRVIFHRSRLQQLTTGQGTLLAVGLSREEAESRLLESRDQVSLAAINSPRSVTLSGESAALESIAALLPPHVFHRWLQVDVPFHSRFMDPLQDELLRALDEIRPQRSTYPMVSTVHGRETDGRDLGSQYWWRNMRDPVQFGAALAHLSDLGCNLFLEVGPHPVLASAILECREAALTTGVFPSLRRGAPERATLLESLGGLHVRGVPVHWEQLLSPGRRRVHLPRYPWQREGYWRESRDSARSRLGLFVHPLLGIASAEPRPAWTCNIDLDRCAYLADHRIQGAIVFPGVAYVEMAVAAARECFGDVPVELEDITFRKACMLRQGSAVALRIEVDPGLGSFDVHGLPEGSAGAWIHHAAGKLWRLSPGVVPEPAQLDAIRGRCATEINRESGYARLERFGLEYGPTFRGIKRLWLGSSEAFAEVRAPREVLPELMDYQLHPALLDACWQVLVGALSWDGENGELRRELCLPTAVDRIRVLARLTENVWCHAVAHECDDGGARGDVTIFDELGNVLVEVRGLTARRIGWAPVDEAERTDDCLYEFQWRSDPLPGRRPRSIASQMPTPSEIVHSLRHEAEDLANRMGRRQYYEELEPKTRPIATAYVVNALRLLCFELSVGQHLSAMPTPEQLGVVSEHRQLFQRMLRLLEEEGVLETEAGGWKVTRLPDVATLTEIWQTPALWANFSAYTAELTLVRRCGEQLADVLRGATDPLQVIFPDGSLNTVDHLYQDSPTYRIYNTLVRHAVTKALAFITLGRNVRILEIGGGTGGMTAHLLPWLPSQYTEYVFTDVTPVFLTHAEQKFRDYPFIRYRLLDIELDPEDQGFQAHSFDLILASDALHATADLRQSLAHVRKLLASEGLLVLLEGARVPHWALMIFGLLKSWWRFTDVDLRGNNPWVPWRTWESLLRDQGFTDSACISDRERGEPLHNVILARSPRVETGEPTTRERFIGTPGSWLFLADAKGVAACLARELASRGDKVLLAYPAESFRSAEGQFEVRPTEIEDLLRLVGSCVSGDRPLRGVMHLWSLDAPFDSNATAQSLLRAQDTGCISAGLLVRALAELGVDARLWLVTGGAQPGPSVPVRLASVQAPLWGLGRVVINEHANLRCTLVDLGVNPLSEELEALGEELRADTPEQELSFRGGDRYVRRLVRRSREPVPGSRGMSEVFRVEMGTAGVLSSLTPRKMGRLSPGPGQVEVRVDATGLNFKDMAVVLGLLPKDAFASGYTGHCLGVEAAGRVVSLGEGVVELAIGDEVVCFAPHALASHMVVDTRIALRKPSRLSMEEAAGLIVPFATAHYALHHLGRLRAGERVLVHAAAGGVGLAAVQLARLADAEVLATAGSQEKRALLRAIGVKHIFDSRTTAFVDQVREVTAGKGVDIVLNSLAGEALVRGLSVLGHGGRFIELGKQDIYADSRLGLRALRANLSFSAVDLDQLARRRAEVVVELAKEVFRLLDERRIHPLPHRVFPVAMVGSAFRHMAKARHMGRVVVSMRDGDVARVARQPEPVQLRTDGTYLVTGGLGGFGFATAQWLAARGARHLVLVGRTVSTSERARGGVARLRAAGVDVQVVQADVAQFDLLAGVMEQIKRSMPPLRGVVHAAMVLDDGFLYQVDRERFQNVLRPKLAGSWNLHLLTRDCSLDFFVLFSSLTAVLGSPGQANYAAANAFLDSLAHHRRALNLPALSVNWGVVADVGYVADRQGLQTNVLKRFGASGLESRALLGAMGDLIGQDTPQVAIGRVAWDHLAQVVRIGSTPLLKHLAADAIAQGAVEPGSRLEQILAAPPDERRSLLRDTIRDHVARVLGASVDQVEVDHSLPSLGLDSLMAFELKYLLERELQIEVSPMRLMEGVTVAALARVLDEELAQHNGQSSNLPRSTQPAPDASRASDVPPEVMARVAELSDEEVDALLRSNVEAGV